MRQDAPFDARDLDDLGAFLDRADAVVGLSDVRETFGDRHMIGMRHDVDNYIAPAVAMAEWEAERGYSSTYFILHTAPYWKQKDTLAAALDAIADCGHEIGFHVNAITAALKTRRDPIEILTEDLAELRSYGHPVTGVAAHGDHACYVYHFHNDEVFLESPRPAYGLPEREVSHIKLRPVSRESFGLEYDANWLPRQTSLSDSGGRWSQSFDEFTEKWPLAGQLHMLVHPDWWADAFVGAVTA